MGEVVYCSFCDKSQHEVKLIVAGPSVFICDECVDACMEVMREAEIEVLSKRIAKLLLRVRWAIMRLIRRPCR